MPDASLRAYKGEWYDKGGNWSVNTWEMSLSSSRGIATHTHCLGLSATGGPFSCLWFSLLALLDGSSSSIWGVSWPPTVPPQRIWSSNYKINCYHLSIRFLAGSVKTKAPSVFTLLISLLPYTNLIRIIYKTRIELYIGLLIPKSFHTDPLMHKRETGEEK